MGLFDFLKKKKSGGDDGGTVTQSVSFTVGPNVREVDDAGVAAIDSALNRVGHGEVIHLLDPRRINAFASGGPSTWSVAFVPVGEDHLFITYGNSDRVDPARKGVGFELSIRVPANVAGLWPGLLLRQLVRYMLTTQRELRVSDFMPTPGPLPSFAMGSDPSAQVPSTTMDTVFLVPDPLLPTIDTPRGPIEVRRVVGIFPDERDLMQLWSVEGLAKVFSQYSPALVTDPVRRSFTFDIPAVEAMVKGSREEGSQFGFVAVPGVRWEASETACRIVLPGGDHARRIYNMARARLPFGRNLLVHDTNPEQRLAVALVPSEQRGVSIDGEVLVLQMPLDATLLASLAEPPEHEVVWNLS